MRMAAWIRRSGTRQNDKLKDAHAQIDDRYHGRPQELESNILQGFCRCLYQELDPDVLVMQAPEERDR
jgi:hypothetical protein